MAWAFPSPDHESRAHQALMMNDLNLLHDLLLLAFERQSLCPGGIHELCVCLLACGYS